VVINCVKGSDARGTWLESHYNWQIRTFLVRAAVGRAGVRGVGAAGALADRVRHLVNFRWRMTTTWPAGLPFYQVGPGSAATFAERVDKRSNSRIKIQVFAAGELLPAFAAQYVATVPVGMSVLGHCAWLPFGGGNALWEETYRPLKVVPFAAGCSGVQTTGWFKKEIRSLADRKGVKMRIPGLAGRICSALGVEVRQLPGGENFPALERGVIDAAEFVVPFLDARPGLPNAGKNNHASGWHEPSTVSEIVIQRKIGGRGSRPSWSRRCAQPRPMSSTRPRRRTRRPARSTSCSSRSSASTTSGRRSARNPSSSTPAPDPPRPGTRLRPHAHEPTAETGLA
jgi:TRAP-type mannitol/chloroaromatic compound transport system substrate-binding protein